MYWSKLEQTRFIKCKKTTEERELCQIKNEHLC